MCHHWGDDRDATWERAMEDVPEDDPEAQDPEPEREPVEAPSADD